MTLFLALTALAALVTGVPAHDADVTVRNVNYRNNDVLIDAKLYLLAGTGPHAAVLFVHGRCGWDEPAGRQVRRIAERGFAVLAPNGQPPRAAQTTSSPFSKGGTVRAERWVQVHKPFHS